MEELVVKVTELNPQLEMEIQDLLSDMGRNRAHFEECDLFARMDQAGRVLGVACAAAEEKYCHLLFVAVRLEARGQGTGSMIINHVLSHYAGSCDVMYLLTEDAAFFERFGFGRIDYELLPEDIRLMTGRDAPPGKVAMEIELPGRWTGK